MEQNILSKLKIGLIIIFIIIIFGTLAFMIIEKWTFLDSFYMTIITISTTGFKEVRPLTPLGMILTVFLIISGVFAIAYTGGRGVQLLVESHILRRRRMAKMLSSISDHYIICGFG